jgi:hypothetical protein
MGWRTLQDPADTSAASVRTPDYAAPLYAWRLWEVESAGRSSRLRSLYRNCIWPVGAPVVARCEAHRFRLRRRTRHAVPAETCTCGIHAVPFYYIRMLARQDRLLLPGRPMVLGTVAVWGDVIECEDGWRAEYAYPSGLFLPSTCPEAEAKAEGLEDYGVPIHIVDTRDVTHALDAVAELAA